MKRRILYWRANGITRAKATTCGRPRTHTVRPYVYIMQMLSLASIIIFAAICILLITGCSSQQNKTKQNKSMTTMRIAAILPDDRGYWERVQSGFNSGAEGLDVDIKVSYSYPYFDIPQMTELIKAATAARVDAIIIQGTNDADYLNALKAASEKGILIAFVDADIAGFSQRLYVGTDNYSAGWFMAEKLIEMADGRTDVAVLMGGEGFLNLDSRLDGFRDGIAEDDNIRLLAVEQTNFDAVTIIEKYYGIVEENPTVNAIVCLDGTGGAAFGGALGPSDTSSLKILCFDMLTVTETAIKNGIIDGTIIQDPIEMGEKAIQELYKCFVGQQSLPVVAYTDISFITADDLEDTTDEDR